MEKKLSNIQPSLDETKQLSDDELILSDRTGAITPDKTESRVYLSFGTLVVESSVRYSTSRGSYFDA
jgi:hypothetical protein